MKSTRISSGLRVGLNVAVAVAVFVAMVALWAGRPVKVRAEEPQAAAGHAESDADAIRGLVAKYAKSVDDADTALAAEIWSKFPDVSFIHPRGHERGWDEVKRNVYEKLMGATFSERKLSPRDVVVHVLGDAAWAEFYWDFSARFRENGQPLKTKGRETQVYRKAGGRWELVHVHYSGTPVTEQREGF
jgi:ketosteroid isomerase-like protein